MKVKSHTTSLFTWPSMFDGLKCSDTNLHENINIKLTHHKQKKFKCNISHTYLWKDKNSPSSPLLFPHIKQIIPFLLGIFKKLQCFVDKQYEKS